MCRQHRSSIDLLVVPSLWGEVLGMQEPDSVETKQEDTEANYLTCCSKRKASEQALDRFDISDGFKHL